MKASIAGKLLVLAVGAVLYSGCAVVPHVGIIYSDATAPGSLGAIENRVFLQGRSYQILGTVRGEAYVENYAGVVAMGDYSIDAAYRNALQKKKGADCLIDVRVDRHTMRVAGFYIKATTIVTGTAVKIGSGAVPAPVAESGAGEKPPPRSGEKTEGKSGGGESGGEEGWWGK
ncbi:MAG: TRL domain-containing protein [Planctomycetota bacterium]|jgi:hypothetical protein